jgi:hypothetical protein
MISNLKRLGYKVGDVSGYQDHNFDPEPTDGQAPPQIKGKDVDGKKGMMKLSNMKPVQKVRDFIKLTKQYKKELYRIAHIENFIQTNQFFSCENMMLLAMTNSVFNEAYREVQEVQELANFKLFKDYVQLVYSDYNIWKEIYSSVDVHKQMKLVFPKFRGIPHENRLLKIARNNIRFYRTISVIEINTENFKRNRRHIIYSLVWTVVSTVYAEIYVTYLYDSVAWLLFAMILFFSFSVLVIIAVISLPSIFLMCVAAFKTRKLLSKREFVKIGDTISDQEKHVKHKVATGLATNLFNPIGSPVSSQKP